LSTSKSRGYKKEKIEIIGEKRLSVSDKNRHYIVIPAKIRAHFPPCDTPFKLKIGARSVTTYIDAYKRLRLGSRAFNWLRIGEPGTIVIFEKRSDRKFVLKNKKAL